MIIFTDSKRKQELENAKLKPYDGTTIYEIIETDKESKKFLGYELKPFKVKKRDGTIEVGTTVVEHYQVYTKQIKETEHEFYELPEWWIQREREQLWAAKVWESGTPEHKSFWRIR